MAIEGKEEKPKVIILCGGLGTRLKEQTEFVPKPMIHIGHKPIIWHIMKIYDYFGFKEFILPLGYRGEMIKDYFVHYEWKNKDFTLHTVNSNIHFSQNQQVQENWIIHFRETGIEAKTARRVFLIKDLVQDDPYFFLTYGDGLADIDLHALLEYHKTKNCLATISGYRPKHRFGIVEHEQGMVLRFKEKPQMMDLINCGFMIFNREALSYFTGEDIMLENILPRIATDKQLAIYPHEGSWHCMDTQREYEELMQLWQTNPPWKIWK